MNTDTDAILGGGGLEKKKDLQKMLMTNEWCDLNMYLSYSCAHPKYKIPLTT